jgi:hypothetical protein
MEAWLEKHFMGEVYTPSCFRIRVALAIIRLGMRIMPKWVAVSEYRFTE